MNNRVCVYGLWHLGSVTAACLASLGLEVVGLDTDAERVEALRNGQPPVAEPGLPDMIRAGVASGKLTFTADASQALADTGFLWVTFDTPVDEQDRADPAWVRAQLEAIRPWVRPDTVVVVSSQVPVGFTAMLERDWSQQQPTLRFACVPENLRLGTALDAFLKAERLVVGLGAALQRERMAALLQPLGAPVEWMSLESAEMTKHALNGFLALCVAYSNELARISERIGADAGEVERGLRTDPRVGKRAYVSAGAPFAGGTLARDIAFLSALAHEQRVGSPLIDAVKTSNDLHKAWVREQLERRLADISSPRVALLGLTYKPGTDTLRRSSSLELATWLAAREVRVSGFDPAISVLPPEVRSLELADSMEGALERADIAVLATAWPQFRELSGDLLVKHMRRPCVVDQAGFVRHLADDTRVDYVRVGRP